MRGRRRSGSRLSGTDAEEETDGFDSLPRTDARRDAVRSDRSGRDGGRPRRSGHRAGHALGDQSQAPAATAERALAATVRRPAGGGARALARAISALTRVCAALWAQSRRAAVPMSRAHTRGTLGQEHKVVVLVELKLSQFGPSDCPGARGRVGKGARRLARFLHWP